MKEVAPFREFTFGWIIFAFSIPIFLLQIYLFLSGAGDRPLPWFGFLFVSILMVIVCLLFYGLTTELEGDTIKVSFGIGLIRRRIPISHIKSAEPVTSPWWYGWGIRLIPNGMMYNISGFESVELKFKDTARVFRIGSKRPNLLKKEIEARMKRWQRPA